jgi:hypothetical protein
MAVDTEVRVTVDCKVLDLVNFLTRQFQGFQKAWVTLYELDFKPMKKDQSFEFLSLPYAKPQRWPSAAARDQHSI